MSRRYDLLVVGGGPTGCYTAWKVAERGYRVGLLEEHRAVGQASVCGGLVTPRALDFLPPEMRRVPVLAEVCAAWIHPPSSEPFEVRSPPGEVRALVIDRSRFDECFCRCAERAGVDVYTSTRFVKATKRHGGRVYAKVRNGEGGFESRVLVGADGYTSRVARSFGFPPVGGVVPTSGVYTNGSGWDERSVHVHVGRELAPGFFGWVIPTGERLNIGLGTGNGRSPRGYIETFLKRLGVTGPERGRYASGIPIGPRDVTVRGNVALVGDAAGHVKPMSGGGLYTGLRCADILAKVVMTRMESGPDGVVDLSDYERNWRMVLGKEFRRGLWMRRIYLNMSDEQMDEICRIFRREDVLHTIREMGDVDYPSRLVLPLLRQAPSLAKFAGPLLKSLI